MRSVRLSLSILVMGFLCTTAAFSQWTAPWEYYRNTPIPINDFGTATSTIIVPDNFNVQDLAVMVNISHSKASDLRISLKDPSGATYILSEYNGGFDIFNGAPYPDYSYTIFDNNPSTPLGAGLPGTAITDAASNNSPLFRGIFIPETPLPSGINGNGSWTIEVYDNLLGNTGTLQDWGLIFNRYNEFKDIRIGGSIQLVPYFVSPDRWAIPYVDDMTTIPQYRVHGYRPEANTLNVRYLCQNSKTTSGTALNWKVTDPKGTVLNDVRPDVAFSVGIFQNFGSYAIDQKGMYKTEFTVTQRSDIYSSRDDNSRMDYHVVTPGSLGWDNGDASTITDITAFQDECNAALYQIFADQTLTSVDIWHSDAVELEPTPTPGYGTIRVYDNTFTLLYTFGPYDLPKQGNKWVSYPIPPTLLPAGNYWFSICVENMPAIGGTGFGVDLEGSAFVPGSAIQRYYGNGVQAFSFDNGGSWFENFDAAYGTFMLRPNFIDNHSDVGVICFEAPTGTLGSSFNPIVRFGSFSHNPHLPNLLTVGKVSVIDNTGNVVREVEARIPFGPSQYEVIVTFPAITGLPSGTYTLRAEVWRSDDENDINNVYERTFVRPLGPVVVSYSAKISSEQREDIRASLTEQGYDVEMFDRTFDRFEFPENGAVVWAGDLSDVDQNTIREYVERGNFFAVVPDEKVEGDFRTQIFSEIANTQEVKSMEFVLQKKIDYNQVPKPDYSLVNFILEGGEALSLNKAEFGEDNRIVNYLSSMMERVQAFGNEELRPDRSRGKTYRGSETMGVQGLRIGNLSVAQIFSRNVVDSRPQIPVLESSADFVLEQNYPNPFNPTTTINYNIPKDANVNIRVYDMLGREVATLVNTVQSTGVHTIVWDATDNYGAQVSSGIYVYRMESSPIDGSQASVITKKMILNR